MTGLVRDLCSGSVGWDDRGPSQRWTVTRQSAVGPGAIGVAPGSGCVADKGRPFPDCCAAYVFHTGRLSSRPDPAVVLRGHSLTQVCSSSTGKKQPETGYLRLFTHFI